MGLRSMTGYGRATRTTSKLTTTVEIRSVNSRHLAVRIKVPGEWVRLESRIEAEVRKRLQRGAVDVFVRVELPTGARTPRIDLAALGVYQQALSGMGQPSGGAELLRLPGVVSLSEPDLPERAVEKAVGAAVREALASVEEARSSEGERLTKALRRELKALERHVRAIARHAPVMVREAQQALRRRASVLLEGLVPAGDEASLRRELALLADRSDVTEELDRLASHLVALEGQLDAVGAVGRELDFLLQEVGREVNTVGSKCSDVTITNRVVSMKGCVERLREQAANIE